MKLADCYNAQDPATIKAQGFDGVMRYISHQEGKCITMAEATGYREAGLIIGLVFEDGATNAALGATQGALDGQFAADVARMIGYPSNCVIFGAVDFEAQAWQLPVVDAYFSAFRNHGYPTGPYGSAAVVESVLGVGMGTSAWQTAAWSGGVLSKQANLYQDVFGQIFDTDVVETWTPLWGMGPSSTPAYTPPSGARMNFCPGKARTPNGKGYWMCKPDGSVLSFGDAQYHGGANVAGRTLARPVVGMAAHPTASGYWLVGADGGVFSFGAASFYGSTGGVTLTAPVDSIVATPTGSGYWLFASDGGVFAYGDAGFYGSGTGR